MQAGLSLVDLVTAAAVLAAAAAVSCRLTQYQLLRSISIVDLAAAAAAAALAAAASCRLQMSCWKASAKLT